MKEINKRRLRYIGHAVRSQKTDLMSTALMGRVEGCRKSGRPAMSLMDNITTITGLSLGGHHDNHWAVSWWTTSRQSLGCLLVDNITTITGLSLGGQHHDNHWAVSWWTTSRQSLGCLLVDNITIITGLSLGGQHHDNHWAVSWRGRPQKSRPRRLEDCCGIHWRSNHPTRCCRRL